MGAAASGVAARSAGRVGSGCAPAVPTGVAEPRAAPAATPCDSSSPGDAIAPYGLRDLDAQSAKKLGRCRDSCTDTQVLSWLVTF